jgi:hypothetical protein
MHVNKAGVVCLPNDREKKIFLLNKNKIQIKMASKRELGSVRYCISIMICREEIISLFNT